MRYFAAAAGVLMVLLGLTAVLFGDLSGGPTWFAAAVLATIGVSGLLNAVPSTSSDETLRTPTDD